METGIEPATPVSVVLPAELSQHSGLREGVEPSTDRVSENKQKEKQHTNYIFAIAL